MPFCDPDGNVIGTFGISRDITEKKAAEERLQEFNRELEAKVQHRTQELATTNEKLREEIEERIRALTRSRYIECYNNGCCR